MHRLFLRRRHVVPMLTLALVLGVAPAGSVRARPPMISDEPAGDPGDGVLRPADQSTASVLPVTESAASTASASGAAGFWLLVPAPAPAGQPWPLVFHLVRVDRAAAPSWWHDSIGGRWHRAP